MKKITFIIFMALLSFCGYAQLDEDFESNGTNLPPGWNRVNVAGPAYQWVVQAHTTAFPSFEGVTGTHAAFINRETMAAGTVSEDWLITPVFEVPTNGQLRFQSRLTVALDQGTIYELYINTTNASADPADFDLLEEWTEFEINPVQQAYNQVTVNLPDDLAGDNVRIAFVMKGNNGDRWLVDMVQVIEECLAPTNLIATNIGLDTATLNWTNNSSATSFEIEIVDQLLPPTGSGFIYNGLPPYNATAADGLSEDSDFKFYVRAICDDEGVGNNSPWAGPFNFSTVALGATCEAPITITSLPYTTTDNTSGYGDDYSGSPGSSGCGSTSSYLNGDDVVYAYEALEDGVISIDMTNTGTYAGIFVYDDCADIGVSCLAGGVGGFAANDVSIDLFPVTGGTTYYFVISTWAAPQSTPYTLTIQVVNCPPPTGLGIDNIGQTTAELSWDGNGSSSWEIVVQEQNGGLPTGSGITTTNNTNYPATDLEASTFYEYYVRADCGDGTFSTWSGPFVFNTSICEVDEQCQYTFVLTDTYGDGWNGNTMTVSQNDVEVAVLALPSGSGTSITVNLCHDVPFQLYWNSGGSWAAEVGVSVVNSFDQTLYTKPPGTGSQNSLLYSGIADCITPACLPPGNLTVTNITTTTASLGWGGDATGNWEYYVIEAGQPAPGEATVGVPTTTNPTLVEDLDADTDYVFYVRYICADGVSTWAGPRAFTTLPTCPQPTTLSVVSVTSDGATLQWTETGTATEWEVYIVQAGSPAPGAGAEGIITTQNPFTTPDTFVLLPYTNYVYYVRALCAEDDISQWSGPSAFQTAIANNNCEGAVTLTVNPTEACAAVTPAAFAGATASPQATTCTGISGPDIWFEFTAEGSAHGIELSNFNGAAQPIVLALYEGDNCDELTQLYCSANNVINATGLIPGTLYTVRATINLTSPNLNTTFNVCVNTPDPPANNNQSECVITTVNFDFEIPELGTSLYPSFINHNTVQGWRTTASDQMMEFWPQPNYENVPAYSGTQFIELNANLVSGVYQDYETPQTTVFSYGFAHRGRQGTDTCQLLAGPPGGPYTTVQTVSTGNTAWSYNTGTYTVPAGQPVTRFIFQSVSSVGGASVGNYLDAITFTANNGILSANPLSLDCVNNSAAISAAGVGTWAADPDNPTPTVIANANSNNTTISGFGASGTYLYSWTTQYCTSTLEVTFELGNIDPPTVTDITYCENATAVPLTAQALPNHTLNWYENEDGGSPLAGAPTPDTSTSGTVIYYVSQISAIGCESPRVAIEVTVNETPPVPDAENIVYCQNATASPLTADVLPGNTLNWYTAPAGGNPLATAPTPNTSSVGSATYYVSQITPEMCESPRTAVVVTISPTVTPITAFSYSNPVCIEGTNPLPQTGTGFTTGGIYTADAGITIDPDTGEIDLTQSTAGTYTVTYTVTADADNCVSGGSTNSTIIITPLVAAVTDFSYPASICSSSASEFPATAAGFTQGGSFSADGGLIIDTDSGEINAAASTPGTYLITYSVSQSNVTCTDNGSSTFEVVITDEIVPVTAFNYQDSYCAASGSDLPQIPGDFTTGGTFSSSEGLIINPATGEINVADSAPGQYTITYTIQTDPLNCNTGGSSSYIIVIGGNLDFTLQGDCDGSTYYITARPVNDSYNPDNVSYQWSTAQGTTIGTNSNILDVTDYVNSTGNDAFPLEFMLTVSSGSCENSSTITVLDISCTIQRGISPNNDGMNDSFDLTSLNVSKLSIFNRYGKQVFTYGSNYTNQWHGQSDNGDELPTGTYFYVIERSAGDSRTGWIYINRQQ